jgi:hypothetical protein
MGRGLSDLVNTLFVMLPTQVVIVVMVIGAALLFPGWLFSMRSKQIRGLIRRRVRAAGDERAELADEAMLIANEKGPLLIALAREAIKMNQRHLFQRAITKLNELSLYSEETAELEASISRETQALLHPVEVLLATERLLNLGMNHAAKERVEEALQRFPDNEELLDAHTRVLLKLSAPGTPPTESSPN